MSSGGNRRDYGFCSDSFATDYYGLAKYDGTELYEYVQSDVTDSEWGTRNFDYPDGKSAAFCSLPQITG